MATKKKTTKSSAAKSATKKSPTKKSPQKGKSVAASSSVVNSTLNNKLPKSFKIRRAYLILGAILIIAIALIIRYRGVFVAAMVNGQPISRVEIVREAEKQSGQQALQNVVRNTLIEQEAREQGVTVSQQEIDEEIQKVEENLKEQGQELNQVLETQNLTRDDLSRLIRLDKLVAKIVGEDIEITDEEVNDYIENNREILPGDQTDEELAVTVRENLKQQKLNEAVQAWLSDLEAKANIRYFVQY